MSYAGKENGFGPMEDAIYYKTGYISTKTFRVTGEMTFKY